MRDLRKDYGSFRKYLDKIEQKAEQLEAEKKDLGLWCDRIELRRKLWMNIKKKEEVLSLAIDGRHFVVVAVEIGPALLLFES